MSATGGEQIIIAAGDGIRVTVRAVADIVPDLLKAIVQMIQNVIIGNRNERAANERLDKMTTDFVNRKQDIEAWQNYLNSFDLNLSNNEIQGFDGEIDYLDLPEELFSEKVGMEKVATGAFKDRTDIQGVRVAPGLSAVGQKAFENCINITDVDLPDGLVAIGEDAFSGCSSLESIRIPDNAVYYMGHAAFKDCSSLKNIRLPVRLSRVPKECFKNCAGLETMHFSKTLKRIDSNAFENCSSLKEVHFINDKIKIHPDAFIGCDNIQKIHIPKDSHMDLSMIPNIENIEVVEEIAFLYPAKQEGSPSLSAQDFAKAEGIKDPESMSSAELADQIQEERSKRLEKIYQDRPTEKQIAKAVSLGMAKEDAEKSSKGDLSVWISEHGGGNSIFNNNNKIDEIASER